jgi:hypothetical protein
VLTYDGSNLRAYLNGTLQWTTSDTITPITSGKTVLIGNGTANGASTAPFDGAMDDVRFYNRALSASEIKQLYNLGK